MAQPGTAHGNLPVALHHWQWLCLIMLGIALCLSGPGLSAQDIPGHGDSAHANSAPMPHANANVIQLPVLVLSAEREKLSVPIASDRFSISFNGATPFQPTFVRREGDDPIQLAVFLDARRKQNSVLPKIDETIANLAPAFLHPSDRVSIYAIDCGALVAVEDVPAEPWHLKSAVDTALSRWTARRQLKQKSACTDDAPLWDLLAQVTGKLSTRSGWRAILAVTNGEAGKSRQTPADLATMAAHDQVAIFALDPWPSPDSFPGGINVKPKGHYGDFGGTNLNIRVNHPVDAPKPLSVVCESSGGALLTLDTSSLAIRMQQVTGMLRDRYILKFPRPSELKAGKNIISVRIDKSDALVRPAGDSISWAVEASMDDSAPIPADDFPTAPTLDNSPGVIFDTAPQPWGEPSASTQRAAAPVAVTQLETPLQKPPSVSAPVVKVAAPLPETKPPSVRGPLFKTAARLTVEDVTVTNAWRMPVHGLSQSDFAIKEDGQPQPIKNFEEYGTERQTDQAGGPQLPPHVYSNALPQAPTTGAANILLLDDVSTGLRNGMAVAPENMANAKKQSARYLSQMPAGTQVAILQMRSTLRVVQDFTSDKNLLLAALNSASYQPVAGSYVVGQGDRSQFCGAANMQSRLTVKGLENVAAFLSGVKGRKNLIWFTPGTPWLTHHWAFYLVACLTDYTMQLQKSYALLTAVQVALYPIDPRGLVSDPSESAVVDVPAAATVSGVGAVTARQEVGFGVGADLEHYSLEDMADATGGTAYFNRNDLYAVIGEVIANGADYYSLSYVPPLPKYDGKYHTIEVEVDRPNLQLRYHPGYTSVDFAKTPDSPGSSPSKIAPRPDRVLLASMGHGQAASTQILFDVRVVPSASPAKPGDPPVIGALNPSLKHVHLVRYDLSYSLAPDQISLEQEPDGTRKGSIEFAVAADDGEGRMLNIVAKTVKYTIKQENISRFMQRPLQVLLQFDLPSGDIFLRLGVMDVPSKRIGTLEIPQTVAR